jgi:hypothetical protein
VTIALPQEITIMAKGSKRKYTSKQNRRADRIAEAYKERGKSSKIAKARAWRL